MEYRRFAPVIVGGLFVFGGCGKGSDSAMNARTSGYSSPASTETRVADIAYNMKLTPQEKYAQLEALRVSMGDQNFSDAVLHQMNFRLYPQFFKALGVNLVISAVQQVVESRQHELVNGKQYNPRDILDSTALNSMPGALVGTDGSIYVPVQTGRVEPIFRHVRDGSFYTIENGRWQKLNPAEVRPWTDPRYDAKTHTMAEIPHDYRDPSQRRQVALSDGTTGSMTNQEARREEVKLQTERRLQTDPIAQRARDAATHAGRILQGLQNPEKK